MAKKNEIITLGGDPEVHPIAEQAGTRPDRDRMRAPLLPLRREDMAVRRR
jgi:hypothetical protein